MSAALPQGVFPPLFNRYDAAEGHGFGNHVDNAIRYLPDGWAHPHRPVGDALPRPSPDDYDGGELVVEDSYGAHRSSSRPAT